MDHYKLTPAANDDLREFAQYTEGQGAAHLSRNFLIFFKRGKIRLSNKTIYSNERKIEVIPARDNTKSEQLSLLLAR